MAKVHPVEVADDHDGTGRPAGTARRTLTSGHWPSLAQLMCHAREAKPDRHAPRRISLRNRSCPQGVVADLVQGKELPRRIEEGERLRPYSAARIVAHLQREGTADANVGRLLGVQVEAVNATARPRLSAWS